MNNIVAYNEITILDLIDTATYIYYSPNEDGSGAKTAPDANSKYIGIYSGPPVEGGQPSPPLKSMEITWSAYVGPKGDTGNGIKETKIEYATDDNGITPPELGWDTAIPEINQGDFLWTRTTIIYDNDEAEYSYSVSRIGEDGDDGIIYNIESDYEKISKFIISEKVEFIPQNFEFNLTKISGENNLVISEGFDSIFEFTFFDDTTGQTSKFVLNDLSNSCYTKNSINFNELINYEIGIDENYVPTQDMTFNSEKVYYTRSVSEQNEIIYEIYEGNSFEAGEIYYEKKPETLESFLQSLKTLEGHLQIKIFIQGDEIKCSNRVFSVSYGTTEEGARLLTDASKIQAIIGHTSIDMNVNGLTITNGGFYIQKESSLAPLLAFNPKQNEYEEVSGDFDSFKDYYIFDTELGAYIKQTDMSGFTEGVTYYTPVQGELTIQGKGTFTGNVYANNGYFRGTVEAVDGSFQGEISAKNGSIGGFIIESNKLHSEKAEKTETDAVTGKITYTDPYIVLDGINGLISAKNIDLGDGAKVSGQIEFSNGNSTSAFIRNPFKYDGQFININDGTILLNSDGSGNFGNILINPQSETSSTNIVLNGIGGKSEIYGGDLNSSNYFFISPEKAIFKNVDVTGTIHSSIFETGVIQAVGSSMIFKASSELNSVLSNGAYEYFLNTNYSDFSKGTYVYLIDGAGQHSIGKISDIEWQGQEEKYKITFLDGTNNSINNKDFVKIIKIGKIEGGDYLGIGINSSSVNDKFLRPQGFSFVEFNNLENHSDNSKLKLFLGNLASLKKQNISGYGLFGENVYLTGSLTTLVENNSYAGVNTLNGVNSTKFGFIEGKTYYEFIDNSYVETSDKEFKDDKTYYELKIKIKENGENEEYYEVTSDIENIVFWAGSTKNSDGSLNGDSPEQIKKAPFQVTDKGSLYASQGVFEGTIITNASIEASALRAAAIYGTGESPALSLYDVKNGISFYSIEEEGNKELLRINSDGFYATIIDDENNQSLARFLEITNREVIFNGKIAGLGNIIDVGNFRINGESNSIGLKKSGLEQNEIIFSFDFNENEKQISLDNKVYIKEEEVVFDIDEVKCQKDFSLNEKMVFRKTENGYDLYVS